MLHKRIWTLDSVRISILTELSSSPPLLLSSPYSVFLRAPRFAALNKKCLLFDDNDDGSLEIYTKTAPAELLQLKRGIRVENI